MRRNALSYAAQYGTVVNPLAAVCATAEGNAPSFRRDYLMLRITAGYIFCSHDRPFPGFAYSLLKDLRRCPGHKRALPKRVPLSANSANEPRRPQSRNPTPDLASALGSSLGFAPSVAFLRFLFRRLSRREAVARPGRWRRVLSLSALSLAGR